MSSTVGGNRWHIYGPDAHAERERLEFAGGDHSAIGVRHAELEIVIALGVSTDNDDSYDPATSKTLEMEILASGEIV